jgi:hypothetical protein
MARVSSAHPLSRKQPGGTVFFLRAQGAQRSTRLLARRVFRPGIAKTNRTNVKKKSDVDGFMHMMIVGAGWCMWESRSSSGRSIGVFRDRQRRSKKEKKLLWRALKLQACLARASPLMCCTRQSAALFRAVMWPRGRLVG